LVDSVIPINQSAGSTGGLLSVARKKLKELRYSRLMPVFIIVFIMIIALFLRAYYSYGDSADNGWLMSGGSDSYYYHRLMEHAATTGEHLHIDPMLNFPDGARNPRPPLYTFSVAVPAVVFQPLFGDLTDSLGFFFITSTAIWGALTIVPVYLIAKDIFGRKSGYLAALFLAIMPSSVERSVATLCDHDSFALFLIVLTVYFLMKSLKVADTSKWIDNWTSPKSIGSGLKMMFAHNHKSVLYAALAGLSFSAIAMAWVGFTYIEVILLASFLIEILINKFKGVDSTTHTMLYLIMFGVGFLVTFPVYHQMDLANMDIPVYLFLAALVVGILFSVTRDLPWVVVMPLLAVVLGIALAIVTVVFPALGEAIFSGQGYFASSKLYETIAEAKAPIFSQLALSFGIVTFYLSLIGLVLMLWKIPKRLTGDFIIITVWLAVAIFMAASAGRFVFNASPAFALSCAWITVLIIDRLNFKKAGKLIDGSSGSYIQRIRKSIKIRHYVGALFLVFMLIAPNVWFSLDAAIPSNDKGAADKDVYNSIPSFMRPATYTNNSIWYFGSFGFNLPMPENYFPAFWDWFAQRDSNILPQQDRPAYVSWWDYGFESIDAGHHPAVADNFQQGYQIGGNILLAPGEEQAIGLMTARMVLPSMYKAEVPKEIGDMLTKYGASPTLIKDVIHNTSKYKKVVLADPGLYDPATPDISPTNVIWRYLGVYFASLTLDKEVDLYRELCNYLGESIGYISVDSRLLPKSYNDVGVFYAPAKLTDRYIDENGNPADYFVIAAIDENGNSYSLSEARTLTDVKITSYELVYSPMFYKTMLYRAYAGFAPTDAGQETNDGIPGLSGKTAQTAPMPGWNLTHFMMVYRTCYYNPMSDGSGVWTAISLEQALDYDTKIKAKEMDGVVDLSPVNAYQAGVVTLRYYDGAVLSGRITTPEGYPAGGIRVTVQDEWGVPHQSVFSNAEGVYSVILPPGKDLVTFSTGLPDTKTLIARTTLTSFEVNVSEEQGMRKDADLNGDSILDWQIIHNIQINAGILTGNVFWDIDRDGNYTSADVLITNSTVTAYNTQLGINYRINATTGAFKTNLTTGTYRLSTVVNGVGKESESTFIITPGIETDREIARVPCQINGTVRFEDGALASGSVVQIFADGDGYPNFANATTDASGNYSIAPVLPGSYILSASYRGDLGTTFQKSVTLTTTDTALTVDFMVKQSGKIDIRVIGINGEPFPYAHVSVTNAFAPLDSTMVVMDSRGQGIFTVPGGTYSLIVHEPVGDGIAVGGSSAIVAVFESSVVDIVLSKGHLVSGRVLNATYQTDSTQTTITFQDGLVAYKTATDLQGRFSTHLPAGDYDAIFNGNTISLATKKVEVPTTGILNIQLLTNATLFGQVWNDQNENGAMDSGEFVSFADISAELPSGVIVRTQADFSGRFEMGVPQYSTFKVSAAAQGYEDGGWVYATSSGLNASVVLELDVAPVIIDGIIANSGIPLRNTLIEFFNDTRYVNFTSDSNGEFSSTIYPGIYEVKVASPMSPGSSAYYYIDKMIAIFFGTNIHGLELSADLRIKVGGTIQGVPANRSVVLLFNGPTQKGLNVFGTFETYLAPGSYVLYAYDDDIKRLANISTFYVSSSSTNITIALTAAQQIQGEPQIGQRQGNRTLLRITDLATGIVVNTTLQPGNPFMVVLPEGEYGLYFDMRFYEAVGGTQRFYKMTNETAISLHNYMAIYPIMTSVLDNSTLKMRIVDQYGNPISAEVLFLTEDKRSVFEAYTSDANGMVDSSIHPGPYNIYFADSETGNSYFGQVTVSFTVPVNLNITATPGNKLTVFSTAEGSTSVGSVILTITNLDNGALLQNSENFGTNSITTLLPDGNYRVVADSRKQENGKVISYSGRQDVKLASDTIVNIALARQNSYDFEVSLDSTQKKTAAIGDSVEYLMKITNIGNIRDSYLFSGSGEGLSFSFPSDQIQLDFGPSGSTTYVPVTITISNKTQVDHQDFYIFATSTGNSSIRRSVLIEMDILPSYSFSGSAGLGGNVNGSLFFGEISVFNTGNAVDNYTLTILNTEELQSAGWEAKINGLENLTVPLDDIRPGLSQVVNVTMKPIRGDPIGNISVAVMVVSNHTSVSTVIYASPSIPDFGLKEGAPIIGDGVFTNDIFAERDVENIVLLAVMFTLLASIFIMRKIRFGRFLR